MKTKNSSMFPYPKLSVLCKVYLSPLQHFIWSFCVPYRQFVHLTLLCIVFVKCVINSDTHKNTERHTAPTIVSWSNHKQWVIDKVYIFSQSSQGEWINWKHTAPRILQWITERICLILITHSTKYISQAFYSSMSSDKFAQWWYWDGLMYK